MKIGSIKHAEQFEANLTESCVPSFLNEAGVDDYERFLVDRRRLMAKALQKYYAAL